MNRHIPVPKHTGIYKSETSTGWSYEVCYTDSNGKRRWKVCGHNLQDALDYQADIRLRLRKGEKVAPQRIRFQQVADEWLAAQARTCTESSLRSYELIVRNYLVPRFGTVQVQKISPDDISLWLHGLTAYTTGNPLAGASKQSIYTALHQVFQYGCNPRRGYLSYNPCDGLEAKEKPKPTKMEPRIPTADELKRLKLASPPWLQQIIVCAQWTGMRAGEILGLQWSDVDFDGNQITVSRQRDAYGVDKPTKGKESREIPLFAPLRTMLVSMPSRFQGGYVFVTENGNPYWYSRVQQAFVAARVAAGVSDDPRPLRMHDLRHAFASVLLRDGKDVAWVSDLLGHKSIQTTLDTYAHVIRREDRSVEATARLKEAFGE